MEKGCYNFGIVWCPQTLETIEACNRKGFWKPENPSKYIVSKIEETEETHRKYERKTPTVLVVFY